MSNPLDGGLPARRPDPRLTVLPAIRAPIDEGVLIPRPPRSMIERLLWLFVISGLAAALLGFAFLHATPMG